MNIPTNYLNKFKKEEKKISREQYLADEIYKFFDKKAHFGMLMKFIKLKGWQAIYEIFNEIKKADANDKLKLFMWKIGQERIIYQ